MSRSLLLTASILFVFGTRSNAADAPPRFRVELPATVLTDVSVKSVRIEALMPDGKKIDTAYNGRPLITGLKLTIREPRSGHEVDSVLGGFKNGVLELKTDLQSGRKVFIVDDEIIVDPDGRDRTVIEVRRTNRWWSILPPLLAVVLAIWLRSVLPAMFAAVWSGAVILLHGDVVGGFKATLEQYLVGEIVKPNSSGDYEHLLILLFTMFLGAMIGVMSNSGGTAAIVHSLARFTRRREHGQVMAWVMGFAIFFDDYANTLLVGGTMRPVTDRLRISREKLAFIVDSTAAPIAGLAVISTWVGVEVGFIQSTYEQIYASSDVEWNAYSTFLATLAFRFYPLHLLLFVFLIAYTGRDFGPMLRAEKRALQDGDLGATDAEIARDDGGFPLEATKRELLRTALIPLAVLVFAIMVGLYWSGADGLDAHNEAQRAAGNPEADRTFWTLLKYSQSTRVMFFSAFLAAVSAVITAVTFRCLSITESIEAWLAGAKSMFTALMVLIFAWAIATICDSGHLNTAGFLVELSTGYVSPAWVPMIAFLLAAAVAFATGSSFSTMGLLMPLFITMTHYLLVNANDANPNHHLMLASIGAVLAGAIFGDHCSPISDTTVLSSAATGCDHLQHVVTQFPYAMVVAGIALLFGYIPVGFGFSPIIMLPLGVLAVYAVVQFLGKPVDENGDLSQPEQPTIGARLRKKTPKTVPDSAKSLAEDSPDKNRREDDPDEANAAKNLEQANLDDLDVDWDNLPG